MRINRLIITGLLLAMVALTAGAQTKWSPQGCRRGTPRPQSVHLSRGEGVDRMAGGDFYHGVRHQLTILVSFNDRLFVGDEAATLEQWNMILNGGNAMEAPFKGSVHDYFYDQSYGDFNVIFDLLYVQVGGDAIKYASNDLDDENSQFLVADIVDILKTRDIDWGIYDWNGDGYINQLLIIYAGHGMHEFNGDDLIWPHQWWMSEHLKDDQEEVYCDPIPVSSGGKDYLVDSYCAMNELTKKDDYGSFGTICHEYSHCFGLPDFYYNGNKTVVGEWDLMDGGNFNGDGYLPSGYSAHERWLMGWLKPIELNSTSSIVNMPALADEGRAYLIRNDGYENEYYLVENRQQRGWDEGLPGSGILIFHVDYDPSIWPSTMYVPNSFYRKRYELFHANNLKSTQAGWGYPYQENNSLTNTSTPEATLNHENKDGEKLMSKPITNMAVEGGLASFDFTVTTTGISEVTRSAGAERLLYRFGMIDIMRDTKGNIRKVIRR